jgi:hypothetical protein
LPVLLLTMPTTAWPPSMSGRSAPNHWQLMTLIAAIPGGVLEGAAPAAAVDDAEMKGCLIGS